MDKINNVSKIRKFIATELINTGLFDVYLLYWLEMEHSFLDASEKVRKNLFSRFLVDYLTIQNNGLIPKNNELFDKFVGFYKNASKFQQKEIIIKNIFRYSVYYLKIIFADISDTDIRVRVKKINAYNAKDAYPFLMEVFEDFEFAHINRAMLLEILDTVIGFIEERNSKKPSQIALSFAGLSSEINKMLVLKDYTPRFVVDEQDLADGNTINTLVKA